MILPEPILESACARCAGGCCSRYFIELTGSDAFRIMRALSLDLLDFAGFVPATLIDAGLAEIHLKGPRAYRLCMHKRDLHNPHNARSPCVFLVQLRDGTGRCGVYAPRPMACRVFPTFEVDDALRLQSASVCPPGAWETARIDAPSAHTLHGVFQVERDLFHSLVRRWNRVIARVPASADEAAGAFIQWMTRFYASVSEPLEAALDADADAVIGAWRRASCLGEPPVEWLHTSRHAATLDALGASQELLLSLREALDAAEALLKAMVP